MARATAERSPLAPERSAPNFREVFDQEHDFVWRSLVHLGVPTAHADDALQEVFMVVHRRLAEYQSSSPLRAWLWGISRNVALNARRSLGREARRRGELMREPTEASDTTLLRSPELAAVREVLLEMEETFRDVLVLSDIEGMTAPEIATMLDVKLNTVYSRLRLARERLAAALEARGFTERSGP